MSLVIRVYSVFVTLASIGLADIHISAAFYIQLSQRKYTRPLPGYQKHHTPGCTISYDRNYLTLQNPPLLHTSPRYRCWCCNFWPPGGGAIPWRSGRLSLGESFNNELGLISRQYVLIPGSSSRVLLSPYPGVTLVDYRREINHARLISRRHRSPRRKRS